MKSSDNVLGIKTILFKTLALFIIIGIFHSKAVADGYDDFAITIEPYIANSQSKVLSVKASEHDRYTLTMNGNGNFTASISSAGNLVLFDASTVSMPDTKVTDATMSSYGPIAVSIGQTVYVSVHAPSQTALQSYTITYNLTPTTATPPIMGDIPDHNATTGIYYALNISDYVTETGNPVTNYNITGSIPNGLAFNSTLGTLTGFPTTSGSYNLTVTAEDADGTSNPDSFIITIADGVAIANDDSYFTMKNSYVDEFVLTKNVMLNTMDYGPNISVTNYTMPANGALNITADGNLTYSPDVNFTGIVTFTYTITDSNSRTDTANVTINVLEEFPQLCYGYAYKQGGIDFTEYNDGTQAPRLVGTNLSTTENIEMTLYIKNLSTFRIHNLVTQIQGIDPTQLTYESPSTTFLEDGPVRQNEYFFTNYEVRPLSSTVDTPINAYIELLDISGIQLSLFTDINLCSSAGVSTGYNPSNGRFNVVHNNYFPYPVDGNSYYNIPTQVTKREGNFKIISLDPSNLNTLKNIPSTTFAVDIINASYFNDTTASCNYPGSAISERIQIITDTNTSSTTFDAAKIFASIGLNNTITTSAEFYQTASSNAAFRVSVSVTDDGNDDLVQLSEPNAQGEQMIENFPEIVQVVGACAQPTIYPLNATQTGIATRAAQACGNAGNYLSQRHIQACMECIYGYRMLNICSRDNFAIRPEAFMIKIDDVSGASQSRLADNVSGVAVPTQTIVNMAADYDYNLEITATDHISNSPSVGYNTANISEYTWEPRDGHIVSGCNDDENQSTGGDFVDGYININQSSNNVGEYRLNATDSSWTTVDSNPGAHHSGTYFVNAADCIVGSTVTQAVNYSNTPPFIGCDIGSTHTNNSTAIVYNDYNVTFHPYQFDMTSIVPSHGENNNTTFDANTFIYMSDMEKGEKMSFHLNGNISAVGKNNPTTALSNFVDNCYAKPVTLTINKTAISGAVAYKSRFNSLESNSTVILTTNADMNNTIGNINITTVNFTQDLNGSIITTHNLNFDRNLTIVMNPEQLTFSSYDTNCTNPAADCTFSADLTSKSTQGVRNLDLNVTHLYGRTHASRQRYNVPNDDPYPANIYYESYCFGTIGGNTCNKSFLPNGFTSKRTDDTRWFINEDHNTSNDGFVGIVVEKGGANVAADIVDATDNPVGNPSTTTLGYDGTRGYPYKTTMQNSASPWLIYNETNPMATRNEFQVEFDNQGTWTGENETDTTTKNVGGTTTNRRLMW